MSPKQQVLLEKIESQIGILAILIKQYESEKILQEEQRETQA